MKVVVFIMNGIRNEVYLKRCMSDTHVCVYIHYIYIYMELYIWCYTWLNYNTECTECRGWGWWVYCKYHTLCCILLIYSDRDHGTCRWCPSAKWCQIGTRASAICWVGCDHNMTWAVTRLFVCSREVGRSPTRWFLCYWRVRFITPLMRYDEENEMSFMNRHFFIIHLSLYIYICVCVCVSFHGAHN